MLTRLLYQIPGAPPVNVQTNTKGLMAWFTQDHIVSIVVAIIATMFVWTIWKILKGHPVIMVVAVLATLVVLGAITLHPAVGHAPPPVIPLPKGH